MFKARQGSRLNQSQVADAHASHQGKASGGRLFEVALKDIKKVTVLPPESIKEEQTLLSQSKSLPTDSTQQTRSKSQVLTTVCQSKSRLFLLFELSLVLLLLILFLFLTSKLLDVPVLRFIHRV